MNTPSDTEDIVIAPRGQPVSMRDVTKHDMAPSEGQGDVRRSGESLKL